MPQIQSPFINGMRYDFTSLNFSVNTVRYFEVQDLSYKDNLAPGNVRGTGAARRGRTRGTYDADGSMTMYKQEFENLAAALMAMQGLGFGEQDFTIVCSYGERNQQVLTDTLFGVRIKSVDNSHKEGSDALVVKCDLDIMKIDYTKKSLVSVLPF